MSGVPAAALGCPGCAARDEQISGLREREAALTAQVADLQERLARLERLLSRNSGNSSVPPSADDLPGTHAAGTACRYHLNHFRQEPESQRQEGFA